MTAEPVKGTILLVEDEPAVKGLFAQALRREGYTVHEARNGVEALEVEKTIEHVDVLVTDVVMPYMKGPELARHLRAKQEDLKVIFVSGYAAPGDLGPHLALLQKPFVRQQLIEKVREALGEGKL
ncbi:MAG TPA: response regulator [Vicinamibacterales bacterium]|nr:response regulator [Vicinamibacterales bacterium]